MSLGKVPKLSFCTDAARLILTKRTPKEALHFSGRKMKNKNENSLELELTTYLCYYKFKVERKMIRSASEFKGCIISYCTSF